MWNEHFNAKSDLEREALKSVWLRLICLDFSPQVQVLQIDGHKISSKLKREGCKKNAGLHKMLL